MLRELCGLPVTAGAPAQVFQRVAARLQPHCQALDATWQQRADSFVDLVEIALPFQARRTGTGSMTRPKVLNDKRGCLPPIAGSLNSGRVAA